jgi:hypothetical protein
LSDGRKRALRVQFDSALDFVVAELLASVTARAQEGNGNGVTDNVDLAVRVY